MKLTRFQELKDKYVGPVGSPERTEYEAELANELAALNHATPPATPAPAAAPEAGAGELPPLVELIKLRGQVASLSELLRVTEAKLEASRAAVEDTRTYISPADMERLKQCFILSPEGWVLMSREELDRLLLAQEQAAELQQQLHEARGWEAAGERLPEDMVPVLAWGPTFKRPAEAYRAVGDWWFAETVGLNVTHWQPLPPAPQDAPPPAAGEAAGAGVKPACGWFANNCPGCQECDAHNAACCPDCNTYAPGSAVCPECGTRLV